MQYQTQFSLKDYNTFGVDVKTKKFISVTTTEQLKNAIQNNKTAFLLGGGSNILLTKNIATTTIHINLKGIDVQKKSPNHVEVTVAAGENWHDFVLWCIDKNYGGLENLSLIPGNVGTSPIQNIGAYGVEVKDCMVSLEALNKNTLQIETFTNKDCEFGYRNSIFKHKAKNAYVITSVTFKLTTKNHHIHTSYGAIKEQLKTIQKPTLKDISKAVISIRNSKLPDPKKIGNSGSFFKNPIINSTLFEQLQKKYPAIPFYVVSNTDIKIPAGWLIEKIGFKGKQFGNVGVHHKQALVLINHGSATGEEVHELAKQIQLKVKTIFSIALEIEVNIL